MRASILPAGVELEGEVRGTGDLVVRGQVLGSVDVDGVVTVDASGSVRGEIRARAMIVRGLVEGPVTVLELLRLEPGARVLGDVQADRVSAATGAVLRGRVRMTGADRLRRTVGGTLTAPFTSSGQIEAPRPEGLPPLSASAMGGLAAPGLPRVGTVDRVGPDSVPAGIRERMTEAPHERVERRESLRQRSTDTTQMRAMAARDAASREASRAPVVLTSEPPAELPRLERAMTGPPAPVVPKLGRVRSRRTQEPT